MKTIRKTGLFVSLFLLLTAYPLLSQIPITGEDTIIVATFNIRIFSDNSRDDQELHQICNLLRYFDFVAIQEVRDTAVLDRTVSILESEFGLEYQYIASSEVGRGVKEIYAFVYRTNRVRFLGGASLYPEETDIFIREPFYGKFRSGEFDFYAITMHSVFGYRVAERRGEASFLDDVYMFVQGLNSENDVLLMGDFNLPPDGV
jgi:deoxyribonuclease-1-like protein